MLQEVIIYVASVKTGKCITIEILYEVSCWPVQSSSYHIITVFIYLIQKLDCVTLDVYDVNEKVRIINGIQRTIH